MVIGIGLIKLIFTVNLWRLCSSKLIENESFIRTSRVNNLYVNVSRIEQQNLNKSLTKVLGSLNQKSNLTDKNVDLRRGIRFNRKLDNIGNDRFFYVKSKNANRTNSSSSYYINYQQVYGIRYDPNKIKRSFNFKEEEEEEEEEEDHEMSASEEELFVEITTTSNDLYPDHQDHIDYDAEEEFLNSELVTPSYQITNETNDFIDSTSSLQYNNSENDRPTNITSNEISNIMKPSKIQTALQHFNNRIKNLFFLGVNPNPNTQRFLNVFNVIKFQNVPCASSNPPLTSMNGTCYHKFECDQLGGIAVDTCAGGFGVCCVFQFGCGGSTNQTVSYFKNPDFPAATKTRLICTFTVDLWPSVNQVFLEFLFFELKAPMDGSCADDQFVVAGQSSNNLIPILCGVNSGQHMYIDVESSLDRKLYLSVLAASPDARAFNIRISQVLSGLGQAPPGCLQYYQEPNGVVQTFNYDDASSIVETRLPTYFNNLNYAICIKRLPEYCTIQYTNVVDDIELDFQLVNVDQDGISVIPSGQAGAEIYNCADDYISINGIRLCGEKLNDASVTEDFTINAPVTDYSAGPIIIPIRTNDAVVGRGFKLIYNQQPCQDATD